MKSIGIKLADGTFYPVMEEGDLEKKVLEVTTVTDNQTTVQIDLYRSEENTMNDAEYVDSLEITGLVPHPNGEPNLQLELSMDEEGELHAAVKDPETGASSTIQVALVSRSIAERSEPANFALGPNTLAEDALAGVAAVDSVLRNETDPDAPEMPDFTAPDDSLVSDTFFNEGQVIADDNLISDTPATDDDLIIDPLDFNAIEPEKEDDEEKIIDRDGTAFSFLDETPAESSEKKSEGTAETAAAENTEADISNQSGYASFDTDSSNPDDVLKGISADSFLTIDGSENSGDEGFQVPPQLLDGNLFDDVPAATYPEITDESAENFSDEPDSAAEDFIPPEDSDNQNDSETTAVEKDGLDEVMENPFPDTQLNDIDLSDFDDGTKDAAADADNNFGLPEFDDIPTDTGTLTADITVPPAEDEKTSAVEKFDEPEPTVEKDYTVAPTAIDDTDFSQLTGDDYTMPEPKDDSADFPDFNTFDTRETPASDPLPPAADDIDLNLPDFDADTFDDDFNKITGKKDSDTVEGLPEFDDPFASLSSPTANTDFEVPDFDAPARSQDSDFFGLPDDTNAVFEGNADPSSPEEDPFADAYDIEKDDYHDETNRSKAKRYAVISAICAFICILAVVFAVLIIPRLNKRKTENQQIAQTSVTKTDENTVVEIKPAENTNSSTTVSTATDNAASGTKEKDAATAKSSEEKEPAISSSKDESTSTPNTAEAKDTKPAAQTTAPAKNDISKPQPAAPKEAITAREDAIVVARTPAAVVPAPPAKPANRLADIKYQVRWGDTLWDISNAYYKNPWRYTRIADYNNIRNPDFIRAGQVLLIPAE